MPHLRLDPENFMGSLMVLPLSVLIKHTVSVMGYGFDQNFQANHKAEERFSKPSPMATESRRCCSEKLLQSFHYVCPRMFGLL